MEQETINKITKIAKDQQQTLSEETGVESSIDDSEIKQYLNDVIKEVQQHKQKHKQAFPNLQISFLTLPLAA